MAAQTPNRPTTRPVLDTPEAWMKAHSGHADEITDLRNRSRKEFIFDVMKHIDKWPEDQDVAKGQLRKLREIHEKRGTWTGLDDTGNCSQDIEADTRARSLELAAHTQ